MSLPFLFFFSFVFHSPVRLQGRTLVNCLKVSMNDATVLGECVSGGYFLQEEINFPTRTRGRGNNRIFQIEGFKRDNSLGVSKVEESLCIQNVL